MSFRLRCGLAALDPGAISPIAAALMGFSPMVMVVPLLMEVPIVRVRRQADVWIGRAIIHVPAVALGVANDTGGCGSGGAERAQADNSGDSRRGASDFQGSDLRIGFGRKRPKSLIQKREVE